MGGGENEVGAMGVGGVERGTVVRVDKVNGHMSNGWGSK